MNAIRSVLLIEDNPGDSRLVMEYLNERFADSLDVQSAATLAEGLMVLEQQPVHVVLLDLSLPDSSGLETLSRIQAQAPTSSVVILTGEDSDQFGIAALRAGADDYLAKSHVNGVMLGRAMRHAHERRSMANKLHERESQYRAIFETAEEGILRVSADGRIGAANARVAVMLGEQVKPLIDTLFVALMNPDDCAAAAALLETAPGQRASQELRLLREDGAACWVLAAAGAIAVHGGRHEVVVMLSDITARRLAENELQMLRTELELRVAQRTAELAAANAELEAYNYSVAHDLRTPLNGILGFASIMRDDAVDPLTTAHRQRLQMIERSARGMDDLIGGLLSLAQINRQALQVQALDLSSMASHILERLAQAEAGRQVQWRVQESLWATGDRTLVSAVLENLLHNAVKYTRGVPVAAVDFGLADCSTGAEPVYQVRDNGIGFDPATTGKLFTPFNRLPTSRGFEGVGVGLSTVRRIVERHGGRIWAESQIHVSTSFYFSLGRTAEPSS